MVPKSASNRLTKEYLKIQQNPPPFIIAHPSEKNILEWHYILTGPPKTPYENGQYWGTLVFPPEYPFAPPAIRMHTPSGRFQPSTRLCLSISDFHPKNFNPTWEVSTILIGLLSFMTSDEMTTGSISATEQEKKMFAKRTRWHNSTGGGTTPKTIPGLTGQGALAAGFGNVKAGDGGAKFRSEWPELDEENWKLMKEMRIDTKTGNYVPEKKSSIGSTTCAPPGADGLTRRPGGSNSLAAVDQAREVGQGWIGQHKALIAILAVLGYAIVARFFGESK